MYYFEICDINFVFKKTTCSFLISNAFFEISCGCEGSENKRKPPKHGYQRVIFCWFTNISQPFMHLQYTGKQSPPFYLIHFMIYFFFFFWVNIKCTFYFHFWQTFSDFKFSESYKCRCCFFFYSYMFSFRCFENCLKRLNLIHYYNDSYMQTFLYQTFWDFFMHFVHINPHSLGHICIH